MTLTLRAIVSQMSFNYSNPLRRSLIMCSSSFKIGYFILGHLVVRFCYFTISMQPCIQTIYAFFIVKIAAIGLLHGVCVYCSSGHIELCKQRCDPLPGRFWSPRCRQWVILTPVEHYFIVHFFCIVQVDDDDTVVVDGGISSTSTSILKKQI